MTGRNDFIVYRCDHTTCHGSSILIGSKNIFQPVLVITDPCLLEMFYYPPSYTLLIGVCPPDFSAFVAVFSGMVESPMMHVLSATYDNLGKS